MERDTVAVVLAAGRGTRAGIPLKQFVSLKGKPIISYSIDVLRLSPSVSDIIVVVPRKQQTFARTLCASYENMPFIHIIPGGSDRRASTFAALKKIHTSKKHPRIVVIHDAVRPLIRVVDVERVVKAARTVGAAVLGRPITDTVAEVSGQYNIVGIPDRNRIYATFTPHAYRFDLLWRAHTDERNHRRAIAYDENSALVKSLDEPIKIVTGTYPNLKLTYKEDLAALTAYL